MKGYLSLIPISEKKHKKQSKMTRLCIVLAVFLVTAIFSMADMEMQSQLRQTIRENGYWHISISNLSKDEADRLRGMSCVDFACPYGADNFRLDKAYTVNEKGTILCGCDETFERVYENALTQGRFAAGKGEAVISENMSLDLDKSVGDTVGLMTDGTETEYRITGIMDDTAMLSQKDCYGMIFAVETLMELTGAEQNAVIYYVKIKDSVDTREGIEQIKEEFAGTEAKIGENIKLLGITGKSRDSYMMQLYATAAVLAVLVAAAGILMITSNINSNLAKKTEFFGMLRCLGATRSQIKTFVTLEALNWCKSAVPLGVAIGTAVSCMLGWFLRFMSPAYFSDMPFLAISKMGVLMGCVIGVVTVLLAAVAPANKAARVSPLTAVSGNAYSSYQKHFKMHLWLLPVDIKLGIHHSYKSKKNFLLMIFSFAFSIILFLTFSTGIDFLHHALKPLQVYTPDISVYTPDSSCEIEKAIADEIKGLPGIEKVYGRSFCYDVPIKKNGTAGLKIHLLSYEETQFAWSEEKIMEGNMKEVIDGEQVMTVFDRNNPLQVGDVLTIENEIGSFEVTVGAILTDSPFSRDEGVETIICSEETFERLTGNRNYTIIDMQLEAKAPEETVDKIHALFPESYVFSDQRANNDSVRGAYLSMSVFIYGFICIIALISIVQIMNSIAMSVNARIHEYGTMLAIGAENGQIIRMIMAEAATYGGCGILTGTLVGIPLHKLLYTWIITSRWGDVWRLPEGALCTIILVIVFSCIAAVYAPAKRMREVSVVETLTTF